MLIKAVHTHITCRGKIVNALGHAMFILTFVRHFYVFVLETCIAVNVNNFWDFDTCIMYVHVLNSHVLCRKREREREKNWIHFWIFKMNLKNLEGL